MFPKSPVCGPLQVCQNDRTRLSQYIYGRCDNKTPQVEEVVNPVLLLTQTPQLMLARTAFLQPQGALIA